ncbi:hypothetical protein BANRA_00076 [Escherichia coli]|uniref:Uncharacterized protein n=1 Tax=Escherichia coli TaxID=562 RepID=A0A3P5DK20_ECOLX|nr:hypothetical protein FJMB80155_43260 [Escherichia coli]GHK78581.1 hypothetical protein ECZU13_44460 [Escherichia coli]GHK79233.1 hypothetical protein ECZU15_01650 [Escherichia coli]VCY81457.1 hypothetical protein BANRA_00076 [Escherichia coli]
MSLTLRAASPIDFLKNPFRENFSPFVTSYRPLYFQPERELAGSDFHRRKDRALQGTHNNLCENALRVVALSRKN